MTFPSTLGAFDKRRPAFEAWLLANGSAILAPTNQYEVIRFIGQCEICVIYRDESNAILPRHWQNGAHAAFGAFDKQSPWRAVPRGPKAARRHSAKIRSVAVRDGWTCCYCPEVLTEETATIEHFLSRTHGGPDHLANHVLACLPCNRKVGHLSVREKVEMAIQGRMQVELVR